MLRRPKIGWALEGGGAKGSFTLAVARVLINKGIPCDAIAGTSSGGLTAIILGTDNLQLGEDILSKMRRDDLLPFRLPGILKYLLAPLIAAFAFTEFMKGRRAWFEEGRVRNILESCCFSLMLLPFFTMLYFFAVEGTTGAIVMSLLFGLPLAFFAVTPFASLPDRDFKLIHSSLRRGFYLYVPIVLASILVPQLRNHPALPLTVSCWIVVSAACVATLLSKMSATKSSPLATLTEKFLVSGLSRPVWLTTAEMYKARDPDYPSYAMRTLNAASLSRLSAVKTWEAEPHYAHINNLKLADQILAALATSALPFGISRAVSRKGRVYVDGAVADPVPLIPLISMEKCDVIVVIRMKPQTRSPDDHRAVHPDPKIHWRRTFRKCDLRDWVGLLPELVSHYDAPEFIEPPVIVRWRKLPSPFPKVVVIAPRRDLGSILDFSERAYARRRQAGIDAATAAIPRIWRAMEVASQRLKDQASLETSR